MKKFWLHMIGFSLLLFALVFAVDSVTVSDAYIISKTKGTSFEKIAWNLNLITRHPEKISGSSVFMGPSLVQAGLCDSTLSANGIPSFNLAVNGSGNELSLYFLRRVLEHKPANVYLHLYKDSHHRLHKMTALVYTPVGLLKNGQTFNIPFIQYLFKRVYFIFDYFFWTSDKGKKPEDSFLSHGIVYEGQGFDNTAYAAISRDETEDYFYSFNLKQSGFVKQNEQGRSGAYFKLILLRRWFIYYTSNWNFTDNGECQKKFVQREFEAADAAKIKISQVYMPVIADARMKTEFDKAYYKEQPIRNLMFMKNYHFLDSAIYWSDMTHLSKKGSEIFTTQLLQQLQPRKTEITH